MPEITVAFCTKDGSCYLGNGKIEHFDIIKDVIKCYGGSFYVFAFRVIEYAILNRFV